MSEIVRKNPLTGRQAAAVELLLRDELSDVEIAESLKLNPRTLWRWKNDPEFAAAMEAGKEAVQAAIRTEGIAVKQNRIDAQVARWNDLETIRRERGIDPQLKRFPGGSTGFVTASLKQVKHVKPADPDTDPPTQEQVWTEEFWEHAFDQSLFNAYLNIEKHIGQETGQWEDKLNVSGALKREYVIITDGVNDSDGDE